MNKINRNDPCPCGTKTPDGKSIKYKKCCMNNKTQQNTVSEIGVLRKAYEAKDGDDFFHRYLFGLSRMKDCVYPREKRLEYDKSFSPIFQNLLEAKYAREYAKNLIKKHNDDIKEDRDGIRLNQQINIDNPIDNELNIFFKDFFIRGTMAIDSLIRHTRYMEFGISFLFSDKEDKFKRGLKNFPLSEEDDRFVYLKNMIHQNRQVWYNQFKELRNKIEHDGYKLPDVKYSIVQKTIIPSSPNLHLTSVLSHTEPV